MSTYARTIAHNPYRKRKKEVRDFLFSFFTDMQLKKIVGLAGPNIEDYINYCKSKGYTDFEIYEKDGITAIHQLSHLSHEGIQLKFKDIIHANEDQSDALYDLDYCGTVRHLKDHIAKFKDRFIMTFCARVPFQETIDTFFGTRQEPILEKQEKTSPLKHTEYLTEKGIYIHLTYRYTAAMHCFAKIA